MSSFFKEALRAWLNFQYYPPDGAHEIQNQLWMNLNVMIEGKACLWKSCLENGVVFFS